MQVDRRSASRVADVSSSGGGGRAASIRGVLGWQVQSRLPGGVRSGPGLEEAAECCTRKSSRSSASCSSWKRSLAIDRSSACQPAARLPRLAGCIPAHSAGPAGPRLRRRQGRPGPLPLSPAASLEMDRFHDFADCAGRAAGLRWESMTTNLRPDLFATGAWPAGVLEACGPCVSQRRNVLVTGAAGAGKTTLIESLARLLPFAEPVLLGQAWRGRRLFAPRNGNCRNLASAAEMGRNHPFPPGFEEIPLTRSAGERRSPDPAGWSTAKLRERLCRNPKCWMLPIPRGATSQPRGKGYRLRVGFRRLRPRSLRRERRARAAPGRSRSAAARRRATGGGNMSGSG